MGDTYKSYILTPIIATIVDEFEIVWRYILLADGQTTLNYMPELIKFIHTTKFA